MKDNGFALKSWEAETITDANYADVLLLIENTPAYTESLLYWLEQAARGVGLCELW